MTDYGEMRERLLVRQHEISDRQKQIVGEQARLDSEAHKLSLELEAITQMLDGLKLFDPASDPANVRVPAPPSTVVIKPRAREANKLPRYPQDGSLAAKVRQLLEQSSKPLFPTQIRDELQGANFTGKNLLIMVHTAIERMGESVEKIMVGDRPAYRMKAGKGSGVRNLVAARTNGHANGAHLAS
jgi:hypothetical protein